MSQEKLTQALNLVEQLRTLIPAEGQAQLSELAVVLESARRDGEGTDAEALRSQLHHLLEEHGNFMSVMVHEIRKPMTSIRGYSDMLAKNVVGTLNDMQSQFVQTIRNNVISMEQLVSDISDLTKMRSGRLQASPKMEMLKNIIMNLEKELPAQAEARNIRLTFDIPSGLPLLNIDSARVEQALRKLIDNAIKYTPEGQGEVVVSAEAAGNKLKITVRDNGVGISAEDQGRLGELFFRGDQELVTQTKGYGMGIPIVMQCMTLVGGELFWESESGKGSTFGILLPTLQ